MPRLPMILLRSWQFPGKWLNSDSDDQAFSGLFREQMSAWVICFVGISISYLFSHLSSYHYHASDPQDHLATVTVESIRSIGSGYLQPA